MSRMIGVGRKIHLRKRYSQTISESLQKHKDEYLLETGKVLYTTRELAAWAIKTGRWEPPPDLVLRKCREEYSRALREEYIRSESGPVRVNQAGRYPNGDGQMTFWGDIRHIPRTHMEAASAQRREQIVGDCRQLDRDERYYNGHHPKEQPLQTYFDLRDDVIEGRFSGVLETKTDGNQSVES